MISSPDPESVSRIISPAGGTANPSQLKQRIDHPASPQGGKSLLLESRGVTSQKAPELWKSLTLHKLSVAAKLRSIGETKRALDLEECHTTFTVGQCKGCHQTEKFPNRCDRFYCPECQPRLQNDRADSVRWWTNELKQPKHVVLTVTNTSDLTQGHVKEIKKWFGRLRRTKFASNWEGGFYRIETSKEGPTWHLHIHSLIEARFIDRDGLETSWRKITNGAGYIVRVYDVRDRDYLREVTKYVVKSSQLACWSPVEINTFINAFDGVRSFGVFGCLYGKRTEWKEWIDSIKEHGHKCKCGCSEWWYFSELEWQAKDCVPNSPASSIPPPRSDFVQAEWHMP